MKRNRRFELRLTEQEARAFAMLEEQLKLNRTEIVRQRVLKNTDKVFVEAKELLRLLDELGAEMGRCGNNINQLAKHANVLEKRGLLNSSLMLEFRDHFGKYIHSQRDIEKALRQIIRLMSN